MDIVTNCTAHAEKYFLILLGVLFIPIIAANVVTGTPDTILVGAGYFTLQGITGSDDIHATILLYRKTLIKMVVFFLLVNGLMPSTIPTHFVFMAFLDTGLIM